MRFPVIAFLVLAAAGCGDRSDDRRTDTYPTRTSTERTDVDRNRVDGDTRVDGNTPPVTERKPAQDADNTGRNERDRDSSSVTPADQGTDKADIDRTAEIRKRIVDAKLSSNATNVKVVTLNGKVTLRGPVKSQAEKDEIQRIATEVAGGEANVMNQLEIESDR